MAGKTRYGISSLSFILQVTPPRSGLDPKVPMPEFHGQVVNKETGEPRMIGVHLKRVERVDNGGGGAYYDRSRPLEQIKLAVAQSAGWHPDDLVFVQTHTAWVEDSLWAALHAWADTHTHVLTSITNLHYWSVEKGWVPREEATWFTERDMLAFDMKQFDKELQVEWHQMPEPGFTNQHY